MRPRVNTELLIALTGTALAITGVLLITWTIRRQPTQPRRPFARAWRIVAGLTLILIGMAAAMKKYIQDSGWLQWIESMVMWLLPLISSTVLACGAATFLWAMFADRARGRRRCPRCWYDMSGAASLTCPECGKDARTITRLNHTRRQWRLAALALIMAAVGSIQFALPWLKRGSYFPLIPTRILIGLVPSMDSLHPRAISELDSRLVAPHPQSLSYGLALRRVKPLSTTQRHSLSQVAVRTLTTTARHPARRLLFELMPSYLSPVDAPRIEAVVIAALNDPDPVVRLGAITTLRRTQGFNPKTCIPAVAAIMTPTLAARGVFNDESLLSAAVAYLGEYGASDPTVVPALVALLRPAGSRFGQWVSLHDEVLWALARLGPDAKSALPSIQSAYDTTLPDAGALLEYTIKCIRARPNARREVLHEMINSPEDHCRAFAAAELWKETDSTNTGLLRASLQDYSLSVRVCAAAALYLTSDPKPVELSALDRDLNSALDAMRLEEVLTTMNRHGMSLELVAERLQSMEAGASGNRKRSLTQALYLISYYATRRPDF
jgi:hypothetical protein